MCSPDDLLEQVNSNTEISFESIWNTFFKGISKIRGDNLNGKWQYSLVC